MLSLEWLSAFVPVGLLGKDRSWTPTGAGVLFNMPPVLWVVTAKHILGGTNDAHISVLVAQATGEHMSAVDLTDLHRTHGLGWIVDESHDLAASPMPVSPKFRIKAVEPDNCLPLASVIPSMQCFTVGCPYGTLGVDPQSAPLVLSGVVSAKDPKRCLLFVSAPTFPGNSGGPLVVLRPPYTSNGALTTGLPTIFLAGLILQEVLVPDPNNQPVPSPPLHLGKAISTDIVLDLLRSEPARQLASRIEQQNSPSA